MEEHGQTLLQNTNNVPFKALYRAQVKRTMKVRTLNELQRPESASLWTTLRGKLAHPGSDYFQELFLRDCSNEMVIFSSPRQLTLLKKSWIIVCDGTFKMAPRGVYQVYRVFGFVAHTHSVPLATALMRGKTSAIYSHFWTKIRYELDMFPEINALTTMSTNLLEECRTTTGLLAACLESTLFTKMNLKKSLWRMRRANFA